MSVLAAVAAEVGAKSLHKLLTDKVGARNADLADAAVRAVAARANILPEQIPQAILDEKPRIVDAVREVERMTPELAAVYQKGIDLQLAELQAREIEPLWTWGWRAAWMWALLALWIWALVGQPLVTGLSGFTVTPIDISILLQLTGIFLALYMGGHTIKSVWAPAEDKK